MKQTNSKFKLCPDCGGSINPILNVCSCGYEILTVEVNFFESAEQKEQQYLANMRSLLGDSPTYHKLLTERQEFDELSTQEKIQKFREMIKK